MSVTLRAASPCAWLEAVLADFNAFLLDHASAERKAAAMAVSFVVQYPDKFALHKPMIQLAREELLHYQQVMALIHERNLIWERDTKDPYVTCLIGMMSTDSEMRLLDRLLVGAVVEARGVERFGLIGGQLKDELGAFYTKLSQSESRHTRSFLSLARHYFEPLPIEKRLDRWLDLEAEAMEAVPPRAALH
ncbi:MAG: tRNA-(ms[2]io[6]A)-hydroxylase [Acidobacteria bacterium]|nr:tRNA-(ms[2]io[6]A)-hydroxylase [Acidobacteriota bacterium]